jgi:hypothetical protein
MTLEQTTIRLVVRVRPAEDGRVVRELRRRVRARLDVVRPAASSDDSSDAGADGDGAGDGAGAAVGEPVGESVE